MRVISVKLSRRVIHKDLKPNTVTLKVTIDVRGTPPRGATTMVEVGTYSADPAGNDLIYEPTDRVVPLKTGRTTLEFRVRAGPKTRNGSVVVASALQLQRRPGIRIISSQPEYKEYTAKLITVVP